MHELHVQGKKLCQTGHHASIFGDFLGLFCVNPLTVAQCHHSGDYFLIYNLCSTMPFFRLEEDGKESFVRLKLRSNLGTNQETYSV
ncbi:hypothetical protein H5410_031482 [Solanum commersonii]|uniref:Uncharacterized protein n=1 Tax=Solanum commersonii TaxID=4109 RepID=A0A9J5YKA8_SOLCO|nr:hypothetical protein H5410_031482 [Solanum commersonii]